GPADFRTAPLWGLGQRLFFLHDGRTSDLFQAIQAHSSPGTTCVTTQTFQQFNANGIWFQPFAQTQVFASEANAVVDRFNPLPAVVRDTAGKRLVAGARALDRAVPEEVAVDLAGLKKRGLDLAHVQELVLRVKADGRAGRLLVSGLVSPRPTLSKRADR